MVLKNFFGAIVTLLLCIIYVQTQTIKIFDYAIQQQLSTSIYTLTKSDWQLRFWMRMELKTPSTINSILTFQNQSNEITQFDLDENDQLVTYNSQGTQIILTSMTYSLVQDLNQFPQKKTDGNNWICVVIHYTNLTFEIYINNIHVSIPTYDYSSTNQGSIDFGTTQSNCNLYFANVYISDPIIDINNYRQVQYDEKILGFYFFPFLSQNRQFVENIYNPKEKPLFLKEFYQIPSELFETYQTNNVFTSVKITFPNFWTNYAFYGVKMAMNFSLFFKIKMTNIQNYLNSIIVYHRDVHFSNSNLISEFETKLSIDYTISNTIDPNPLLNIYSSNVTLNLSYLENSLEIINQIWNQSYNFDDTSRTVNLSYLQNLKADYTESGGYSNTLKYFMNGSSAQHINNDIRFSNLDKHYCGININGNNNYYFEVMIQDIIFYQDTNLNTDQFFIDNNQSISSYCQLDNSLPYFQERFLINNNNILTLKNCVRLNYYSRCDKFYKCLRCQNSKCIQCANNFYLADGKCLECFFPFFVNDGQCISGEIYEIDPLQNYNSSSITSVQSQCTVYLNNFYYTQFLYVNSSNIIYQQSLFSHYNHSIGGNTETFFGLIEDYFNEALNEIQSQIRVLTNRIASSKTNIINNTSYACKNYYLHIESQNLKCVSSCPTGYYIKDSKYCQKNDKGCLTQNQSSDNVCNTCDTDYSQISDNLNDNKNCSPENSTLSEIIENKTIELSNETYDDNQYVYNSITFPICDISSSNYLVNQTCSLVNQNQANICTNIQANGLCDVQNSSKITPGYLVDQNNILHEYFQNNYQDWQILSCKGSRTFNGSNQNIQTNNNLCLFTNHIISSKPQFCVLIDQDCTTCNSSNLHICTSCTTNNLLQFDTFTLCDQSLPYCQQHIYFQDQILCEDCEPGYNIVQTDYEQKFIGYCIQNTINGCAYYEINNNDTVCATSCLIGYIETLLIDPECVSQSDFVEHCSSYTGDINTGYVCLQCSTGYNCLNTLGIIDNNAQVGNPCTICFDELNEIENCYVYNNNIECIQCFITHYLQDPQTCTINCQTIDPNNNNQCLDCLNNTVPQGQQCYQVITLCDTYQNIGCSNCDIDSTLFTDNDQLEKCQSQMINCQTISNSNINYCDQCNMGYRQFRHSGNYDLCVLEINNCQTYSTSDQLLCDTCQNNFRVFAQNLDFDLCVQNIVNCQTYSTSDQLLCDTCQSNFRVFAQNLDFDLCVQNINNCQTYSTSDQLLCDTCQNGYRIFTQNLDFDLCIEEINNCQTYSTSDQLLCDTCQNNFRIFSQNSDFDLCVQNIVNCQTYSTTNSLLCDTCQNGYRIFSQNGLYDICDQEIQNCVQYSNIDSKICDNCIQGFRVFTIQGNYSTCIQEIQFCSSYSTTDQYTCQSCQIGFVQVLQQNTYDICAQIIENCETYNTNDTTLCDSCSSQYELSHDSAQCVQVFDDQQINQEEPSFFISEEQVSKLQCYQTIPNCKLCVEFQCLQCEENYYLENNLCVQDCTFNIQGCNQCENYDQTKCISCDNGQILKDQVCQNPCQQTIFGTDCFREQCILQDNNCEECNKQNLQQCLQCKTGYYLDYKKRCQKYDTIMNYEFYSEENCEDYCKVCLIKQCSKCKQIYEKTFNDCLMYENSQLEEEFKIVKDKCDEQTLCFYDKKSQNQKCKKCRNVCNLSIQQDMNVYEISSNNNLEFKRYLQNSQDYWYLFTDKQPNILQIELLNLYIEHLEIQFQRDDLILKSYNCTPKSNYDFKEKNLFFNYKEITKKKSKIEGVALGAFLSTFQLAFPSWLIIYVINSLQKIDILSYVGYTNMGGGTFYNFMNSFPEAEVDIISFDYNNQNDYKKSFKLSQFQLQYFNIINEASVLTLISLFTGIAFMSIWTFIKFFKEQLIDRLKLVLEEIKNQFVQYQYSFLGILQIHIVPMAGRFFLIQDDLDWKKQLLLFIFDFTICYCALQRLLNHFNYKNLEDKRSKRYLTIFNEDHERLENFEELFNFYIALDQASCLLKDKIFFIFQQNFQFATYLVISITFIQSIYYIVQLKKYGGFMKKLLLNYFISEVLFMTFLIMMCISFILSKENSLNFVFNIVYFALNLSKILENFTALYTIKKITENRLSHLEVVKIKVVKVHKTIDQMLEEYELQRIRNSEELKRLSLARDQRFKRQFGRLGINQINISQQIYQLLKYYHQKLIQKKLENLNFKLMKQNQQLIKNDLS